MCIQRNGHVRTLAGQLLSATNERGLRASQICNILILDFQPPELSEINFCRLSHTAFAIL